MTGIGQIPDFPSNFKGFEFENFYTSFESNKILFGFRGSDVENYHFTLHSGNRSGVIDLHKTYDDGRHETLFAIRHEDLIKLLEEFSPQFPANTKQLIRKTRISWLAHHNILIVKGLYPEGSEFYKILKPTKKRKRFTIDNDLFVKQLVEPEYYEDILQYPDGNFGMLSYKHERLRHIGMLFKYTLKDGSSRLEWIKFSDITKLFRQMQSDIMPKLRSFLIDANAFQIWLQSKLKDQLLTDD